MVRKGRLVAPTIPISVSTPTNYYLRLAQKLFRREPDIGEFD